MQALEAKHMQLLTTYGEELEAVTDLFHYNKEKPVVPKNAARHSGSIKWVRGLVERVEAPMEKIRMLNKLVLDTEEARVIFASQGALVQAMKEFEAEHVQAWVSKVSQVRFIYVPAAAAAPTLQLYILSQCWAEGNSTGFEQRLIACRSQQRSWRSSSSAWRPTAQRQCTYSR